MSDEQGDRKLKPENVPAEMKALKRWVCWRADPVKGKVPVQPDGSPAATNDPSTWHTFDEVKGSDRMGFVFTKDLGYVAIDLDHVMTDDGRGEKRLTGWADDLIQRLSSYTELSPSMLGVHIIVKGRKPDGMRSRVDVVPDDGKGEEGRRKPGPGYGAGVEVYDSGRFFTVTGWKLNTAPGVVNETGLTPLWDIVEPGSGRGGEGGENGHYGDDADRFAPVRSSAEFSAEFDRILLPFWHIEQREEDVDHRALIMGISAIGRRNVIKRDELKQMLVSFIEAHHHVDGKVHPINDVEQIVDDFYRRSYSTPAGFPSDLYHLLTPLFKRYSPMGARRAADVANMIYAEESFLSVSAKDGTETVYVKKDGIYRPTGREHIRMRVEREFDETNSHFVDEVVGHIARRRIESDEIFEVPPNLVSLKNGVLNLDTYEMRPYSDDDYFLSCLPVEYDPSATCPNFMKMVGASMRKGDVAAMQEWFGYHLWRDYPAQVAAGLLGDGGNGKSAILRTLKAFLGRRNVTAHTLQALEEDSFIKGDLYGKYANISPDLPQAALKNTGGFKALTGGDWISADRKYLSVVNFTNFAKLSLTANTLPSVKDTTDSFFRRWLFFVFPYTFVGKLPPDGENAENLRLKQPELEVATRTPAELSGILNWSLEGLKRLRENEWEFTGSKSTDEIRQEYTMKSDPAKAFVEVGMKQDASDHVLKYQLYDSFVKFCMLVGLPPLSETAFFTHLSKEGVPVKANEIRVDVGGVRKLAINGWSLLPQEEWGVGGVGAKDGKLEAGDEHKKKKKVKPEEKTGLESEPASKPEPEVKPEVKSPSKSKPKSKPPTEHAGLWRCSCGFVALTDDDRVAHTKVHRQQTAVEAADIDAEREREEDPEMQEMDHENTDEPTGRSD